MSEVGPCGARHQDDLGCLLCARLKRADVEGRIAALTHHILANRTRFASTLAGKEEMVLEYARMEMLSAEDVIRVLQTGTVTESENMGEKRT